MKISIVLGSQYGDEGKGSIVNWLTTQSSNPLVIRFNGGHQAGHTVVHNGIHHVFSSFGAGTLNYTPTYWSRFCTIFPPGFNREFDLLNGKGIKPMIYIDPMAMISTPFDIDQARTEESQLNHGSCGVGFGKTVWRHETLDHSYRIFAKDLKYEWILLEKLTAMKGLFGFNINIISFLKEVKSFLERVQIKDSSILHDYEHLIFEGAQGILLDREHGIFPHVTRSHCTSKNVWEILTKEKLTSEFRFVECEIYYISRCYQTRHGNGPLNGHGLFDMNDLQNIENETNVTNEFQGEFRYAPFFFPNIKYALETDAQYSSKFNPNINIVITCLDQVKDKIPILIDDVDVKYLSKNRVLSKLIEIFPYNGLKRKIILSSSLDTSKIEIHEL
jgi:adenylosuccinate synthase